MDQALLNRAVNTGFFRRREKAQRDFQMAVLEPKLAILDETDSGLDIDALRTVGGRCERSALAPARHDRGHPLPAPVELHRARLRSCAGRGPHREIGRQGIGLELEEKRLRRLGIEDEEEAVGKL